MVSVTPLIVRVDVLCETHLLEPSGPGLEKPAEELWKEKARVLESGVIWGNMRRELKGSENKDGCLIEGNAEPKRLGLLKCEGKAGNPLKPPNGS